MRMREINQEIYCSIESVISSPTHERYHLTSFSNFTRPLSTAYHATMGTPRTARMVAKHLTDIDIVKILELGKATLSQRKFAALMKGGKSTVQHDTR